MKRWKFAALLLTVAMLSSLLFTSCGKKSGLMVGGSEVSYDVLRYLTINARGDIEKKYGNEVWTSVDADSAKKELENEVFRYLSELYAIVSLAERYGITADSDIINERFEAEKKLYMDGLGGDKEFKEALKTQSLSDESYRFITVNTILQEEIYYALVEEKIPDDSEEALTEVFLDGSAVRIKQLVIPANVENAVEIATDAASRAADGEDFDALIAEYRDLRLQSSSDYINENATFFRGLVHTELEETAFNLEDGQVSGVIETDTGYSVIKKYPLDKDFVSNHFDEMKENYCQSIMYTELEKEKDALEIKKDDSFSKIELYKIN